MTLYREDIKINIQKMDGIVSDVVIFVIIPQ